MHNSVITYAARPNATTEAEQNALVSVYRFILDCHAKKKSGPDKPLKIREKGSQNDSRNIKSTPPA